MPVRLPPISPGHARTPGAYLDELGSASARLSLRRVEGARPGVKAVYSKEDLIGYTSIDHVGIFTLLQNPNHSNVIVGLWHKDSRAYYSLRNGVLTELDAKPLFCQFGETVRVVWPEIPPAEPEFSGKTVAVLIPSFIS